MANIRDRYQSRVKEVHDPDIYEQRMDKEYEQEEDV